MLTQEGCKARRRRLWERLEPEVRWLIVSDPRHLVYLANYYQTPFVFRTNAAAAILVLGREEESILIADSGVRMCAEPAFADEKILPAWYDGKHTATTRPSKLVSTVLDRLGGCPGMRFGIEPSHLPIGVWSGLKKTRSDARFVDIEPHLHALKRRKDPDEVALLRKSMAAGEAGFAAALEGIEPGMTELEAYLLINEACMEAAGEQAIVYGDFVTGPRTVKGGGMPTDRKIEKGDLVLLDFSVVINGYRGDFANTFACRAAATDEQQRRYEICVAAMERGESLLKPGAACREIDRGVRAVLAEHGLAELNHSHMGHGLGLGHPDPPYIVPESDDVLEEGDVVTLEPGVFEEGIGGMRVERNYLITRSGCENLTHHRLTIDGI